MNSRKIIITFLFLGGIILLSGCKKFLKELSQDEMTPTTIASLNELLAREAYPYISASLASDGYSFCNYLNLMDDDAKLNNETSQSTVVNYMKPYFAWSDNMYAESKTSFFSAGGQNPYQSLYNRIRGCNVVMDLLPEVSGSAEEKEQLRGEALTLRSYYYFMLVNLYAWPYNDPDHDKNSTPGVPIIRSGGISDDLIARNTVKEVYDFIAKDIEEAGALLEKSKNISTLYRINYRAAWLLASRIFLHMEEWDKVIEYSDKLIAAYPVVTDLNTWKVPLQTLAVTTNSNANFIDPANNEMLFLFSGVRGGDLHVLGKGSTLATHSLIASNDLISIYEPDDMRYAVYNASNPQPNFFLTRLSGYYQHSKVYNNGRAARCFRMAEAYVNRAEAKIRKVIKGGDAVLLQKALDDLNYLRVRRFKAGATNAVVTPASLANDPQRILDFYKNERRREFCFEEFRWFDLRRYGMPQIVHVFNPNEPRVVDPNLQAQVYTLPKGGKRYVMKIPDNIIEANPLIIQND